MNKYLKALLSEKGYDLEDRINVNVRGENHSLPLQVVNDAILSLDKNIQKQIRNKLVMIDFNNGDILDFYKYIVKGLI